MATAPDDRSPGPDRESDLTLARRALMLITARGGDRGRDLIGALDGLLRT